MKTEDPRYLRNESRAAHRLHRRNTRVLRWMMVLWVGVFACVTGAAALDLIVDLGWGYEAKDVWGGLLMILGGCAVWAFATAVNHLGLAMSRRLFGPEPSGPLED